MQTRIYADAQAVAVAAASRLADEARASVKARGRFVLAMSGGRTPWLMLRALAGKDLPWELIHLVQVDERVAPPGHPDRNLTHLRESLLDRVPLPAGNIHPMPVDAPDLARAAIQYGAALRAIAGSPPVIDVAQLGLGTDGHTASLVPGDAALDIADADVAITGDYDGRRRMTLTLPALRRARKVFFVITGAEKSAMLSRLSAGDQTMPAGRINGDHVEIFTDSAAAGVA